MACYFCGNCGNLIDDDYNVGTEGPNLELYCESCVTERQDLFNEEGEFIAAENEALNHQWFEQMDADKDYQERMK